MELAHAQSEGGDAGTANPDWALTVFTPFVAHFLWISPFNPQDGSTREAYYSPHFMDAD